MNLVPLIAEKLGVEIGEEFEANGKTCKFEKDGLIHYNNDGHGKEWWCRAECTMFGLLTGEFEVKKPPFDPEEGEQYWVATWDTQETTLTTCRAIWHNRADCYADKYVGNRFRTEAEAEKHKFEIYEKLKGKKWTP